MKHEIGSMSDRLLEDGCGPGIIDHGHRPGFVGRLRQAGNMLKLEDHRSRTFEIEQRRTGKSRFDSLRIGAVDIFDFDTETGQQLLEKAIGIAVAVADRDHVIAGFHNRKHGRADRRHAAGKAAGGLGPFERGDAALEIIDRGIADARVNIAAGAPREGLLHRSVVRECEQRRLVNRADDRIVNVLLIVAENQGGSLDRDIGGLSDAGFVFHRRTSRSSFIRLMELPPLFAASALWARRGVCQYAKRGTIGAKTAASQNERRRPPCVSASLA